MPTFQSINVKTAETIPSLSSVAYPSGTKATVHQLENVSSWMDSPTAHTILQLLRPDFFLLYRYSPFAIIHQQNIRLQLQGNQVTYHLISKATKLLDLEHMQRIDSVMDLFIREFLLQPLDFVCKILFNVECPGQSDKRFMRTTFMIDCDTSGNTKYGVMCFHDITLMTGSVRPYNYDITFAPDKSEMALEVERRIGRFIPMLKTITPREREIMACLDRGLSSKEIASLLFITKATVDTHRQNMLRKYCMPNTSALLKKAKEEGWI